MTSRDRTLVELAKLRPQWPTHSICLIVDHKECEMIMNDPRTKAVDKAEMLARHWDIRAR